jgi:hypothetical protein
MRNPTHSEPRSRAENTKVDFQSDAGDWNSTKQRAPRAVGTRRQLQKSTGGNSPWTRRPARGNEQESGRVQLTDTESAAKSNQEKHVRHCARKRDWRAGRRARAGPEIEEPRRDWRPARFLSTRGKQIEEEKEKKSTGCALLCDSARKIRARSGTRARVRRTSESAKKLRDGALDSKEQASELIECGNCVTRIRPGGETQRIENRRRAKIERATTELEEQKISY